MPFYTYIHAAESQPTTPTSRGAGGEIMDNLDELLLRQVVGDGVDLGENNRLGVRAAGVDYNRQGVYRSSVASYRGRRGPN